MADLTSPWIRCRCGGSYRLTCGEKFCDVEHTLPTCREYREANTSDEIVRYSERNRAALEAS